MTQRNLITGMSRRAKRFKVCRKCQRPKRFGAGGCQCDTAIEVNRVGQINAFIAKEMKDDFDEEMLYWALLLGLNPFEPRIRGHRSVEWVAERLKIEPYFGSF